MTHHVVISKAGGATTQEAIAARCPMIVNQIVPGQEEGNYELLRRTGAGALATTPAAVIQSLRQGGTTILLTTHYLDEAEALADRVAVIARGKILEVSTPAQLGGRASAKARIQWKSDGVIKEELSDNPTDVVRRLAAQFPGEIPELQVLRPSLEDIYLSMIGEK
jgi:hypothetical protein